MVDVIQDYTGRDWFATHCPNPNHYHSLEKVDAIFHTNFKVLTNCLNLLSLQYWHLPLRSLKAQKRGPIWPV